MKPDDVNNLIGVFMVIVWALKFLYHFEYLRRIRKHLEAQNFISFFRIDNMGYYFLTVAPVFWSLPDDSQGESQKKRVKLFVVVFWILVVIQASAIASQDPRFSHL